jgi:menaquinone-dependent protoporphyrinogen oxidase
MKRLLIAYASGTGTTAEVAAEIGKTLETRGFAVDVRPVTENPPVAGYDAVLIGSAIRGGKWLPAGLEFVRANRAALQKLPVALFVVHFFFRGESENNRKMRAMYMQEARLLLPNAQEAFFAGRFDRRTVAVGSPLLSKFTPTVDRRDWKKIRAWAERVDLENMKTFSPQSLPPGGRAGGRKERKVQKEEEV